jgi:hypothetical protein
MGLCRSFVPHSGFPELVVHGASSGCNFTICTTLFGLEMSRAPLEWACIHSVLASAEARQPIRPGARESSLSVHFLHADERIVHARLKNASLRPCLAQITRSR